MRAILIESSERIISEADLPEFKSVIRRRFDGAKLIRVGTLPSGDGVYVVPSESRDHFFTIGGSGPHYGTGLILGKSGCFGVLAKALTDFEALASIVTFGPPPSGDHVIERETER
ncbi:hypothetical protein [Bradyrhizobium sp. MOS002]|uniref:hypothetical protein n=1 Tax=Bradyrhizobium sp. MOS002 TaxID=2133947 RepID=UPI000D12FFA2|nr:hypothetical protein [Bradyrhizobium sp. MOS002]PSO23145.1 hypothetical protein C7G41_33080 [Bradyrhizobium sp. MOS002]